MYGRRSSLVARILRQTNLARNSGHDSVSGDGRRMSSLRMPAAE